MQYVLLIHQGTTPTPLDPDAWATLSSEQQQEIYAAYREVNETPGVTPGAGLQPPETATTVRVADGSVVTTDGPFVESKEYLGGVWIIEVPDLDVALKLAADGSWACNRKVEVRPFL